ncbi:hypothetical protein WCLP8_1540009 [uncultured Gammaproteobacteria bacterium]
MFEKVAAFARRAMGSRADRTEGLELRKHYWSVFDKINQSRGFRGTAGEAANKRYWDVFNRLGAQRQHLVFHAQKRPQTQSRQASNYYSLYYL